MSASYGFDSAPGLLARDRCGLDVPARRIFQGVRNDKSLPLLGIDLDQLTPPPGDGLLPQMADCRTWPIEKPYTPAGQKSPANLRVLRFQRRSAKSYCGGCEQPSANAARQIILLGIFGNRRYPSRKLHSQRQRQRFELPWRHK
jgi:hypothetical protein